MNCLFVVQGEGWGHMTQALSLAGIRRRAGHEVSAALVGRRSRREVPAFFMERMGAPIHTFESPNFMTDAKNRSVRILPSLTAALRSTGTYRESLRQIAMAMAVYRPDLVVNFFEPLAGIYYGRFRPRTPMVCIAHQYLVHHPAYPSPPGNSLNRRALQFFADVTATGAARRLALSLKPVSEAVGRRLAIVPPLLRNDLFQMPLDRREPFLLAYLLNSGYAPDLVEWHRRRPDVVLHCFWDKRDAEPVYSPAPNLTFHRLDDRRFLDLMSRCTGLVCSAGFESICEAMYLGKPVMMVPVEGHFEQTCTRSMRSRPERESPGRPTTLTC